MQESFAQLLESRGGIPNLIYEESGKTAKLVWYLQWLLKDDQKYKVYKDILDLRRACAKTQKCEGLWPTTSQYGNGWAWGELEKVQGWT